ncbi:MAG: hypothetical protein DME22_13925 [Verrucomicrobia bacterium]|nr:MAG: hypothetical protein DME22_13925 [Verrucomicrobiota bacterium]
MGLLITVYSWRQRARLRASPKKLTRALPLLAPLVVVFGLLRFVLDSQPAYVWRRAFTGDKRASAEFPCAISTETATDSAQGVSIRRLTVNCNVPRRDINLRLSYNEIPPEGAGLTIEQRLDGLRTFFTQQGFTIISCVPDGHGDVPGYRIVIERDGAKTRCLTRVAIAPKAIYRAVATSTSGFHEDPVITRFINSFKCE